MSDLSTFCVGPFPTEFAIAFALAGNFAFRQVKHKDHSRYLALLGEVIIHTTCPARNNWPPEINVCDLCGFYYYYYRGAPAIIVADMVFICPGTSICVCVYVCCVSSQRLTLPSGNLSHALWLWHALLARLDNCRFLSGAVECALCLEGWTFSLWRYVT